VGSALLDVLFQIAASVFELFLEFLFDPGQIFLEPDSDSVRLVQDAAADWRLLERTALGIVWP